MHIIDLIPNLKINISKKTSANATSSRFNEFDKDRLFFRKGISILTVAAIYSLTGCSKGADKVAPDAAPSSGEELTQDTILPVYSVAMNTAYPPFEFIDGENGFDGFDIDLLNAVAERGKFSIEYQPYGSRDFNKIINAVEDGTADMSASSIFITPERQEIFNFSEPYFTMPIYFVGLNTADRPQEVKDIQDKKISIDKGNFILKDIMDKSFVTKNNNALYTDTTFLAFQKMMLGETDLMLENIMTINDYSQSIGNRELFYLKLPDEYSIQLGYITQKGNQELVVKLNKGIQAVKADGTYDKIHNKWFGDLEDKITQRNGVSSSNGS